MGRSLVASVLLHGLALALALLLSGVAQSRTPSLPPMYQVQLVSAAELAPMRTRPEPRPSEPVEEEVAPEPEAVEKVPDLERSTPQRTTAGQEPTPRPGPDSGPRAGANMPLTLEGRPFAYPWYLEQLLSKVQRNWHPTSSTLTATVHFRIERNGAIVDIDVSSSSGNFLFDQAARRAVQAASPLAPLPADYSADWLGVFLDFDSQARLAP